MLMKDLKEYPPKLDIVLARALLRLFATTFSRNCPRDKFSREPKTFALFIFSVELDRRLFDRIFSFELDLANSLELSPIFSFELLELIWLLDPGLELSLELLPAKFSFELDLNWLLDPGLELSLEVLPPTFSFEFDLRSINSIIGFDLRAELIDLVISDCRLADVERTDDDLKIH